MNNSIYNTYIPSHPIPRTFLLRRLHSLSGFFLVLFLMEHLLVNSQAAFLLGEDGKGFIEAVNTIYSLPYLPVIECVLLGFPILIHALMGVKYLREAQYNSYASDGSSVSLKLPRNKAYTWQRITSVVLLFGLSAHLIHMRFLHRPVSIGHGQHQLFLSYVTEDPSLFTLKNRLDVQLYTPTTIKECKAPYLQNISPNTVKKPPPLLQKTMQLLLKNPPTHGEVAAVAPSFGTASLLVVRDSFQSLWRCILYSLFVLAACFHASNGLWTFAISWGVTITETSRLLCRILSNILLSILVFLGLMSIWGSYWTNGRNY